MPSTQERVGAAGTEPRILTEDRQSVRLITLNRPERRNVLDLPARADLLAALRAAEHEARAVVLTGAGGFFCAGGDIRAMTADPSEAARRLDVLAALAGQLVHSSVPVVAAVEGGAYGAGLSLVSAATYVVSGATARFEASFGRIGLAPDTGLTWTLPRRIGHARARRMLLLLDAYDADQAHAAGLVDEVVDDGQALPRAIQVAKRLAELSAPMVAATSALLAQGHSTVAEAAAAEGRAQVTLLQSSESQALRARFLDRSARRR